MSFYLAPIANEQQVDANGSPVSGGKIWTYIAGTTTPATTYTDDTGATPQANPIILNSLGVPASPVWLQGGRTYKFVFQDANGVQTRPTIDDVSGINDPAIASTTDQWVVYAAAPTYIGATSFSVAGDQTGTFQVNRRVRSTNTGGTVVSSISASSYDAGTGLTTVTVVNDSGTLDSGLSQVAYGLLSTTNPAIPETTTGKALRTAATGDAAVAALYGTRSMVRVDTSNGYGSSATMIRRFTNTTSSQGSDITYADSATDGGSFTINTAGVYAISYTDNLSGGLIGISKDAVALSTAVSATAASIRLATESAAAADGNVSWIGYLPAAAVIRAHTDGNATGVAARALFTITRVS